MKCVMIINEKLPRGLIANTSAVLALSIGDKIKGIVGEDVTDQDGQLHRGITQLSIPLLKGDSDSIRAIRSRLLENGSEDIFFVDFCDVAQKSRTYDEYRSKLNRTPADQLNYLGIAIYGPVEKVNRLTGSIGLLR
jgi:hypothetical protein